MSQKRSDPVDDGPRLSRSHQARCVQVVERKLMDNRCSAPFPPVVAALLDRWLPRLPRVASFQLRE
jgi:hypothetical protein